jgi:hypothetical protein
MDFQVRQIRLIKCKFCNYIWHTKSQRIVITCPYCARNIKVQESLIEDKNEKSI